MGSASEQAALRAPLQSRGDSPMTHTSHTGGGGDVPEAAESCVGDRRDSCGGGGAELVSTGDDSLAAETLSVSSELEFDDNPLHVPAAPPLCSPAEENKSAHCSNGVEDTPKLLRTPIENSRSGATAQAVSNSSADAAVESSATQQQHASPVRRSALFDQPPVLPPLPISPPQFSAANSEFESLMLEETEANSKCDVRAWRCVIVF